MIARHPIPEREPDDEITSAANPNRVYTDREAIVRPQRQRLCLVVSTEQAGMTRVYPTRPRRPRSWSTKPYATERARERLYDHA